MLRWGRIPSCRGQKQIPKKYEGEICPMSKPTRQDHNLDSENLQLPVSMPALQWRRSIVRKQVGLKRYLYGIYNNTPLIAEITVRRSHNTQIGYRGWTFFKGPQLRVPVRVTRFDRDTLCSGSIFCVGPIRGLPHVGYEYIR